ncbi:MAG: M23 family metallopeptidase [Elusimicrobia bacterium]|nr:M23 family metallopeptidase [Elusimicrobiota bacterium]
MISARGLFFLPAIGMVAFFSRVNPAQASWETRSEGALMAELQNLLSVRDLAWVSDFHEQRTQIIPAEIKRINRFIWASHEIRPSDNIWKLASSYGTTVESLQSSNSSELIWMKPGHNLIVQNRKGTLHYVKSKDGRGQSLEQILRQYRSGNEARQRNLREDIVEANRLPGWALLRDYEFVPDEVVLIPGVYLEFDTFRVPFKHVSLRVSSGFGSRYHPVLKRKKFHDGLDLPQPHNTPVYASRSGRVIFAGWKEGYGLTAIIKHSDGMTTRYGHMSKIYVSQGLWVEGGKKMIGRVGSTGLSTGPHLHFEIRDQLGRAINPKKKFGRK